MARQGGHQSVGRHVTGRRQSNARRRQHPMLTRRLSRQGLRPFLAHRNINRRQNFIRFRTRMRTSRRRHHTRRRQGTPTPHTRLLITRNRNRHRRRTINHGRAGQQPRLQGRTRPNTFTFQHVFNYRRHHTTPFATRSRTLTRTRRARRGQHPNTGTIMAQRRTSRHYAGTRRRRQYSRHQFTPSTVARVTRRHQTRQSHRGHSTRNRGHQGRLHDTKNLQGRRQPSRRHNNNNMSMRIMRLSNNTSRAHDNRTNNKIYQQNEHNITVDNTNNRTLVPSDRTPIRQVVVIRRPKV